MLQRDIDLIRLAREIAIDHFDIEDLLDRYKLSYEQFLRLWMFERFVTLLASEEEAWNAATNTTQRVKLKSAAVIEAYLEKAQGSLHNDNETLVAKTGLAKLIASFAGIGGDDYQKRIGAEGGGFSIVINLGDRSLKIGENGSFSPENEPETPVFRPLEAALDDVEITSKSDTSGDLELIFPTLPVPNREKRDEITAKITQNRDEIARINADLDW